MGRHKKINNNNNNNNNNNQISRYNANWIEIATESEIPLYERQPEESDFEWKVWETYRQMYPSSKPKYSVVARLLSTASQETPLHQIKSIGIKWDFPVRMQAWVKEVETQNRISRQAELVEMNKRHIEMSDELNEKIFVAIQNLDPNKIEIKDLKGLMQLSTELERKARTDVMLVEQTLSQTQSGISNAENAEQNSKELIKTESIGDVLGILSKAGVLEGKSIGIRQTCTTEVLSINTDKTQARSSNNNAYYEDGEDDD